MRNGQHYAYPNPSNATPGGMTYRRRTSYDHVLQQRCGLTTELMMAVDAISNEQEMNREFELWRATVVA
jgi:hypothetical protein